MHPCPGNWVAIRRAVMYYACAPTQLVQELNVGTVLYTVSVHSCMSDVSMLNVYCYGLHILETSGVLLTI